MKEENIQRLKDKLNRYESGLKTLKAYLVQKKEESERLEHLGAIHYRGRRSAFADLLHDINLWEGKNEI